MNVHLQYVMNDILLIETSGNKTQTAISSNGQLAAIAVHDDSRSQAAALNGMIDQVCTTAGIGLSELAAIAVCSGPGSYTGLRIGLAAAKGLAYAMNKPLMLHNRLELWAHQQLALFPEAPGNAIVITARENEYFVAAYNRSMTPAEPPKHIAAAGVQEFMNDMQEQNMICSGDAAAVLALDDLYSLATIQETDMTQWSSWTQQRFIQQQFADLAHAEPFYMKEVFIHKARS